GTFPLTTQRYAPDVLQPRNAEALVAFEPEPWPRWEFRGPDGTRVLQQLFAVHGRALTVVTFRRLGGSGPARLSLRPFVSGRDYHALSRAGPLPESRVRGGELSLRLGPELPEVVLRSNGQVREAPTWYRQFLYLAEQERGLEHVEDLASPGVFSWDLGHGEAALLLGTREALDGLLPLAPLTLTTVRCGLEWGRRRVLGGPLRWPADAYLVRRGQGKTIVAGYPWFTDWGRDTFIALRGLCLAIGRVDDAHDILLEWAGAVSEGMLPNRFADHGDRPEFNAVDASLWFVVAVRELVQAFAAAGRRLEADDEQRLWSAAEAIAEGYVRGTRHRIRVDDDGLVAAGEPGVQLTWMDAKVGDWVVTPRIGKPVEVQALWVNALDALAARSARWAELRDRARASFGLRFWNEEERCLYDVVDVDHLPGVVDPAFRPNQLFAAGGLPMSLLGPARAREVVDAVEQRLLTPLGLRSLAPGSRNYAERYTGDLRARDGAYHQGTVWTWLMGPFVEAWLKAHADEPDARATARTRFLAPLQAHLQEAGLGHVSEIADADPPHAPRGCPFQAWSLGELLRIMRLLNEEG
ncbi:MAG: amylo-alpha-1,6-glucosidase, partial [Myxococcales bacterium]